MSSSKSDLRDFYEEVGKKYPEEDKVYRTLHGKLRRQFILEQLQHFKGAMLEIGCNRGMYLQAYQNGWRVGLDLSLSVLRHGRLAPNLFYVAADAEQTCFKSRSFNNILCTEVLEHCLHPQRVFRNMAFMLKEEGLALITTPNYRCKKPGWIPLGSLKQFGVTSSFRDGYYHSAFKPQELVQMARYAGFEVLESGTLEHEVKYAAKIPAIFLILGRLLNKIVYSQSFDQFNEKIFTLTTVWIYQFCKATGLEKVLLPLIKEGVRSYVLIRKGKT